ncbi:MAG: redoxin domain-containing protein [Chlamydiales bacterium]|nr:redoxin domain-containing protein [Chlamydiales bacterium]
MKKMLLSLLLLASSLSADSSIYDITAKTLEGQSFPLSAFRGRVLMIVNTASNDRNSDQMNMLEELYQKYNERGFEILAFPSNDFFTEESGTNAEVRAAYLEKFLVTFPILAPVHVSGPNKSPIYTFLTSSKTDPNFGWEVDWSFTKFLVDRSGNVVNRFSTTTLPTDPRVVEAIQKALAE